MSKSEAKGKTTALVAPEQARTASVLARLAGRFGVEQGKMLECLKATAFRGQVSNEQMMALCVVADQYGLNPWTKEIYAFPDKNNGIVPVVGVDGWARIINEHPQFDGVELLDGEEGESCTCTIYRKDRSHPTTVTEYIDECKRSTGPWTSHPRRMLRHKALIQCARIAFGYAGIYDQDEAERILEGVEVGPARAPVAMPTPIAIASGEDNAPQPPSHSEPEPEPEPEDTPADDVGPEDAERAAKIAMLEKMLVSKRISFQKACKQAELELDTWRDAPLEKLDELFGLLQATIGK